MFPRRLSRHLHLIGEEAQRRLMESTVAVVGVGGLGSHISLQLAMLGVGGLILVDGDKVEEDNLNRQILYTYDDIGRPKAEVAARRLKAVAPELRVKAYAEKLTRSNVDRILGEADIIMDGMDNWESRLIVNEYAVRRGKPFIHGGVKGFYGQVLAVIPGRGPCLACLVPKPPPPERISVVVQTVAMTASIQVSEALKLLARRGDPGKPRLILINALEPSIEYVPVHRNPECPVCGKREGLD